MKLRFGLIFGIALVGFALSVALTQHYYELRSGEAAFRSFCNFGEGMNCDVVALSPFAQVLPGFPLSSFSAGWFLVLGLLVLLATLQPFAQKEAIRALFVWSASGLLVSGVYFIIMFGVIGSLCAYCLGIDGLILVATLLSLSLRPASLRALPIQKDRWMGFAKIAAPSFIVCVLVLRLIAPEEIEASRRDSFIASVMAGPVVTVAPGHPSIALGPEDAPVKIIEFSDFQCPHCKKGAQIMNTLLNRFPGKVRVELRNFPLDTACNRLMKGGGHSASCESAWVNFCSSKFSKFPAVYESLFDHQSELRPGKPTDLAKKLGVPENELAACVKSAETLEVVRADIEEGIRVGVQSTPTFFINGRKVEGAYPISVWVGIIEKLLAK